MVHALSSSLPLVLTRLALDTPGGGGGYGGEAPQSYQQPPQGGHAGGQPTGYGGAPTGPPPRSSGKAVAALVLGIVGICLAWIPFVQWISLIMGILAVVLGFLAKKEIDQSQGTITGMGMAITGIVLGIIQLLILLLVVLVFAAIYAEVMREFEAQNLSLLFR